MIWVGYMFVSGFYAFLAYMFWPIRETADTAFDDVKKLRLA